MIVKQQNEGWEIIFQRAHAMLAAQIAFHWQKSNRPERWVETLLAVAEHDDGQLDFKGRQHLTPAGTPLNFAMKEINLYQPQSNSNYAYQKSRWIGLLNSLHVSFLYEAKRGEDKNMDHLLDEQSLLQNKILKDLKVPKKDAMRWYHLLEWCDALSLILCRGLLQPEERRMEVSEGPDGLRHQIWQRKKDHTLVVEPWCFEETVFEVRVESRLIRQMIFKDDAELENMLKESEVTENVWKFKK